MSSSNRYINNDQLIFEYLEGNLRPEEKRVIEHRIKTDPEFKLQFELWQIAYVKEPLPAFNKKDTLYRPVPKAYGKRYILSILAFLLIIGGIGFFTLSQKLLSPPAKAIFEGGVPP